jgi:hypothetical protein
LRISPGGRTIYRVPPGRGRLFLGVLAVAFLAGPAVRFLANPAVASAHVRSGTIAVDYKATVLTPQTSAYTARIYQTDRALRLTVRQGHAVIVLGYLGEPMFRLDGAGLAVNAASPTAVAAGLLKKKDEVDASVPTWRRSPGKDNAIWHDARAGGLVQGVKRAIWSVPMIVDGRRSSLRGTLARFPKPTLLPWIGILLCVLAAAAVPLVSHRHDSARHQERVRRVAIGLATTAAVATVATALDFGITGSATPGAWIAGFDEIVFVAVGIGVLTAGPPQMRVGAALGLGLLALAVGASKGSIFVHPVVLTSVRAMLTRLIVTLAVAAGLAAAGLAASLFASGREVSAQGYSDPVAGR